MREGAMQTVLSGIISAFAWPATLVSAADFIDSKWAVAIDRCHFELLTGQHFLIIILVLVVF